MARVIHLRAPEALRLHEMSEQEIDAYVEEHTERTMALLPDGVKVAGVDAVVIDRLVSGAGDIPDVWVEWTRSCCLFGDQIEDYQPPLLDDITPSGREVLPEVRARHFETQLRKVTLEYPQNHSKARR